MVEPNDVVLNPLQKEHRMLDEADARPRRWRVGLVAHDAKKAALSAFVLRHREHFASWKLVATAATGELLREAIGVKVRTVLSGPRGGDLQLGGELASGEIDALIFLRDPLTAQPHEPDVAALLRAADVHNIPVATNLATAECLVRALAPQRDAALRV
jgi:methylglyoxal synthase